MTTYYEYDTLRELSETELRDMFYDDIDAKHPTVSIYDCVFYPSNMIGVPGDTDHDETFNAWLNDMQDSEQIIEDSQIDYTELIDDWLTMWIDEYSEIEFKFENEIYMRAEDLHSSGVLELVEGELDIHPSYTFEGVRETLLAGIECMN